MFSGSWRRMKKPKTKVGKDNNIYLTYWIDHRDTQGNTAHGSRAHNTDEPATMRLSTWGNKTQVVQWDTDETHNSITGGSTQKDRKQMTRDANHENWCLTAWYKKVFLIKPLTFGLHAFINTAAVVLLYCFWGWCTSATGTGTGCIISC